MAAVLDLSFAPGIEQDLTDLPYEPLFNSDGQNEDISELNISHARVVALTSTPEAPISSLLQHITTLRASHNEISSLQGIEAFIALEELNLSHNKLHILDAHGAALLRSLKRLRLIDFSHNHMRLLDLGGNIGAPSQRLPSQSSTNGGVFSASATPSAGRSPPVVPVDASEGLLSVVSLNLSRNCFFELPDLRSAPYLETLNLSYNAIESLIDTDSKLPLLSLQTILLHHNMIPHVSALVPLCTLASTADHVTLFGCPFTTAGSDGDQSSDRSLWWRPFLLWLCPLLQMVDFSEFTPSERRLAMETLFRENGVVSKPALELMNAQKKTELEAYLRRYSNKAVAPSDALATIYTMEREEALDLGDGDNEEEAEPEAAAAVVVPMSRSPTSHPLGSSHHRPVPTGQRADRQDGVAGAIPHDARPRVTVGGGTLRDGTVTAAPTDAIYVSNHNRRRTNAAPISVVVRALQQKVKAVEEVMEVLWRADIQRRTRAAIVIQKFVRGAMTRARLPEDDAESCRFIRDQLLLYQSRATAPFKLSGGLNGPSASATGAPRGSWAPRGSEGSMRHTSMEAVDTEASSIREVLLSLRSLQDVMRSMWLDLEEYRAMSDREQRRAAIIIQQWYRLCTARRAVAKRYAEKGYKGKQMRKQHFHNSTSPAPTDEVIELRREVANLRDEMQQLRLLVLQSSKPQQPLRTSNSYPGSSNDGEKAIDDLIGKYEKLEAERRQASRGGALQSPKHRHVDDESAEPAQRQPRHWVVSRSASETPSTLREQEEMLSDGDVHSGGDLSAKVNQQEGASVKQMVSTQLSNDSYTNNSGLDSMLPTKRITKSRPSDRLSAFQSPLQ